MSSLVVVGTGLQAIQDLTLAARSALRSAEIVFYLVADSITENYICRENSNAHSLFVHYGPGKDRNISYREMIDRVLESLAQGKRACVAFYGHPGIFVFPSHEMVRVARSRGYEAQMLPGISAEDWLFADIGVDPARTGCQSYEATDFLVHERLHDPRSALVLWQVGVIGNMTWSADYDNKHGARILGSRLRLQYPPEHLVTIYEASEFVVGKPRVEHCALSQFSSRELSPISTLFVPGYGESVARSERLSELGMNIPATAVVRQA